MMDVETHGSRVAMKKRSKDRCPPVNEKKGGVACTRKAWTEVKAEARGRWSAPKPRSQSACESPLDQAVMRPGGRLVPDSSRIRVLEKMEIPNGSKGWMAFGGQTPPTGEQGSMPKNAQKKRRQRNITSEAME